MRYMSDITDIKHYALTIIQLLDPAIRGTENLLNAIVKFAPKVRRVVITSSFAAIINPKKGSWPGHEYSEKGEYLYP